MEISRFTIDRYSVESFVESNLLRCVFHVTLLTNLRNIRKAGGVDAAGIGQETFGCASNGFFRHRGCVSVFDLRNPENDQFDFSLRKCHPLKPVTTQAQSIAILFLAPAAYPRLVPWSLCKKEEAWSQMVVPYVEAGIPGPLSLDCISRIALVRPAKSIKDLLENWPTIP
ncbi:hypothetical protein [Halomonas sp. NO4]|uniref:hypothetical protein n=1 Tax=Halomonas sp. NO4 TaxID=2484813 RepID=UPI0013D3D6F2|nr:hypothetical protein [Halomonas sp. NO4]